MQEILKMGIVLTVVCVISAGALSSVYNVTKNNTIGINKDDTISSVAITKLDQTETPGLGVKITHDSFKNQFKGEKGEELKLKKDGGAIDAITAATISSRAVANGVKEGWDWYMKEVRGQESRVRSQGEKHE